jgi:F0F1-type ATP synthase membrane subunit b/b'
VSVQGEPAPSFDQLLLELRDMIEHARTMPMSASVLVNREDANALLEEILAAIPDEMRHARWLLKERDEFLLQARREADNILESARVQAERMVERTEIAREARRTAQKIVDDADTQARRLRLECEDYVDQKLAEFEVVLERTMQAVQNGRDRLQVTIEPLDDDEDDVLEEEGGFFDQDED